jgi:RNA polymerase sigma-70 factor (ECF subfamily)
VLRRHLVALAQQTLVLHGIAERAFVDIDSLLRPVYGHAKQGASCGCTTIAGKTVLRRGLCPLAVTRSTPPRRRWWPGAIAGRTCRLVQRRGSFQPPPPIGHRRAQIKAGSSSGAEQRLPVATRLDLTRNAPRLACAVDRVCQPVRAVGKWNPALVRMEGVEHERMDFEDFYARTRDNCLRAVVAGIGDLALAEDLVAEAYARAWESWGKVSRHPAPAAWVVRTALNVRVSWWRQRRREVALDGHDRAQPPADGLGMDSALLAAVRRLPRRQREVIVLRIWLDLDAETVASVLGITRNTVGAHLFRATSALRAQLVPASTMEVGHE